MILLVPLFIFSLLNGDPQGKIRVWATAIFPKLPKAFYTVDRRSNSLRLPNAEVNLWSAI
jgi:hypothetical protein